VGKGVKASVMVGGLPGTLELRSFSHAQFKAQEPGSADDIQEFVKGQGLDGVALMEKVDVNGPTAAPVFQWLRSAKPAWGSSLLVGLSGLALGDAVAWNFGKWLLDKDGKYVNVDWRLPLPHH
jgi:glutathione peroxidase